MVEYLTDEQLSRLFQLCEEISAVQQQIPAAPQGYHRTVQLEIARALRVSLAQHDAALLELARMLQFPIAKTVPGQVVIGELARPENS